MNQKLPEVTEVWLRMSVVVWLLMGPQTILDPNGMGKQAGILMNK